MNTGRVRKRPRNEMVQMPEAPDDLILIYPPQKCRAGVALDGDKPCPVCGATPDMKCKGVGKGLSPNRGSETGEI